MLIECPECKKQISDKADICPNCGFPINQIDSNNCCIINKIKYNLTDIIDILPQIGENSNQIHPYYIIGMIRDRTPLDPDSSKKLADIIIETEQIPNEFNGIIEPNIPVVDKPHCPICNSTDLSKISATKKAAKIAAFGIFGMGDNGKTWKCNNCGSKF